MKVEELIIRIKALRAIGMGWGLKLEEKEELEKLEKELDEEKSNRPVIQ